MPRSLLFQPCDSSPADCIQWRRAAGGVLLLALVALARPAWGADATLARLDTQFGTTIKPFLQTYCVTCHGGDKPEAGLDLNSYSSLAAVVNDGRRWNLVLSRIKTAEMPPPKDADLFPSAEERRQAVEWFQAVRDYETLKNAGDPGIVLARRLNNAEYNYSVRDLTGVDIQPTREFPADPSNMAGFDNSGESLAMSPSLLNKYLQAAREVASHLFLKPEGFAFSPYPMLVETDRDKYCVQQIINFYHQQDIDYADYFQAAWRFKHRVFLGVPNATLADFAAGAKISAKYLNTVWTALEGTPEDVGPMVRLRVLWRALPGPGVGLPDAARTGCEQMRDYVVQLRKKVEPRFLNIVAGKVGASRQPLLIWKNVQYATHRRTFDPAQLQVAGEAPKPPATEPEPETANQFGPGKTVLVVNQPGDPDLTVPAGQRPRYEAAFARFCSVFPDMFYKEARGRNYFDTSKDQGRYLSAGFHNVMGYFRDDEPLYELLLDDPQQKQLDEMWHEMDFVASTTARMYGQFSSFGEARGNVTTTADGDQAAPALPEDKEATSEVKIRQLENSYLDQAKGGSAVGIQAIKDYFDFVNTTVRWVEKTKLAAEPGQLQAMLQFAARAYRRPLEPAEKDDLLAYYHSLRDKDGLNHEEAMRESIVGILMAPDFCYRIDLASAEPGAHPLSDYDLASRLSYFLWSSAPDAGLLAHAAAGDLHNPKVVSAEAKRMLQDPRARALAVEFGGNWLDFRHFGEINTVDLTRYPNFTPALRDAMFEEPVRFLQDAFRTNRPVLDLIYANDTFVNPVLAKHYGMPVPAGPADTWVRVPDANRYDRGGLLPMAVFLTKNAPGLRTSPVKRGNWVVKNVLGEKIPPPPPVVPELPHDEAKMDLPLRDMLARHRANPMCAACHARFDALGLVFEGFGPAGEKRTNDLAGRPVDASASFPNNGGQGTGLPGLRQYIQAHRQNDFVDNFCNKLLAYALGRTLMLSDDLLLQNIQARLGKDGYHIDDVVDSIVTSPQFLTKRGRDGLAEKQDIPMKNQPPSPRRSSIPPLSRRTFLRGVGCTVALPFLESLPGASTLRASPAGADPQAAPAFPKRFAVMFMGCGVNPNHWSATGNGADMVLGKTLSPLEPIKGKINVIHGLFNKASTKQGIHPAMTGGLFSGVPIQKGAIIHSGISMDQVIANHVGQDTLQASMVLACEQPMTGYHETNFSNAYSSHISWQNADSPVPNEMYPSLAYDSLFENSGSQRNLSVLDRVKDRAAALSRKISSTDKAKLDEYLGSVRDVEQSIERMRADKAKAEDNAKGKSTPLVAMKRPENGLPEDLREHARLMCDLIALGFQTDKTRVASLILARDLSSLYYPFLNVKEAHHGASHNDTSDGYEAIARFHLGQMAYLAQKLATMPEGDGTVLDHSCIMFMSNMLSGSKHDNSKVPIVTAGGLGGALKTGRTLDYLQAGDDNRKLCSLYLGIMDKMDVKLPHFGDADHLLADL